VDKSGSNNTAEESLVDLAAMSMTELADHIEQTHHTYLHSELPRLEKVIEVVASVHGSSDSRLAELRDTFRMLAAELSGHMMKEEQILFPMVRQLDSSETTPAFHCGSVANPIQQMELEHTQADALLAKLHELTDGNSVPEWACDTYRGMLDALAHFEQDVRLHIHKESNALFPRVIEVEREKGASA
jgi:regulator of cell morphogenesis and NO signaling